MLVQRSPQAIPVPGKAVLSAPCHPCRVASDQWWGWVALGDPWCDAGSGVPAVPPILVSGRDVEVASESCAEGQEALGHYVSSNGKRGDMDVTLASGEGKRKLINWCDAQLSPHIALTGVTPTPTP